MKRILNKTNIKESCSDNVENDNPNEVAEEQKLKMQLVCGLVGK